MRNEAGTTQALGGVYPASALYMRNDWVASHPQVVQKLANASVAILPTRSFREVGRRGHGAFRAFAHPTFSILPHDDVGADIHPVIEIGDVVIDQAKAAR